MGQVVVERISRVEIVLTESERARSGGGPGVHQRRLQHLIFFGAPAHKATAIFNEHVQFRTEIKTAAEIWKTLAHDRIGDDGIDLHRGDVVATLRERPSHIPTAAGSDDERLAAWPYRMDQARPLFG